MRDSRVQLAPAALVSAAAARPAPPSGGCGAARGADLVEENLLEIAPRERELSFIAQEAGGPALCPSPAATGAGADASSSCGKGTS